MIVVLGATPAASAAAGRRVVVPRVPTGLESAYARLHAAGLVVGVPSLVIGPGRVPVVLGVLPRVGSRVTPGAVVLLRIGWRRRGRSPTGRAGWVPGFVGRGVTVAEQWARRHHVELVLRLGALWAAGAPTLLGNYVVARQSPRPGRRTRALMVWGRQPRPAPPPSPPLRYGTCAFPGDTTLLTQDGQAAVASVGDMFSGQWYGCALASGHVWSLGRAFSDAYNGGQAVTDVTLTGAKVGLEIETLGGKYAPGLCNSTVTIVDLMTGKQNGVYTSECLSADGLVVNAAGFAAWHVRTSAPTFTALGDIACPSTSLCLATDVAGNVASSSNPTGGYGAWTFTSGVNAGSIACPSVNLCVAAGGSRIATSTSPSPGVAAWTAGQLPGPPLPRSGLFDVSCPTTSLCVAAGDDSIATSTDPSAGAGTWTAATLPGSPDLFGVSCPSASLCVATDGSYGGGLWTTTNPTGGASAWTRVTVPGARNFLGGVACPSVTLCVAVNADGQVATSTDPAGGPSAWSVANINGGFLTQVACPSTSLCVSASLGGVAWSTNPTGGASAWSHASSLNLPLNDIACPSTTLCVAVSDTGHTFTSTDPTGGLADWTDALIDGPACALTTPCVSEQLLAYDDGGVRTIDTAGPGSGTAIANIAITGNQLTWTHAGTPESAPLH